MSEKVTISERGSLTIPSKLRRAFGIKPHDELIVEETPRGLLLRPVIRAPTEIYTEERIAEFASEEKTLASKLQAGS